jgi:hypothetical protein
MNESVYVLLQADRHEQEEKKARKAFEVGMTLYGYCGGIFGKSEFSDKKITKIIGNFMEVINEEGETLTGNVESWIEILQESNYELKMREKHDESGEDRMAEESETRVYRLSDEDDKVS